MQREFYFEFRIQLASAIASRGTVSAQVSQPFIQWVKRNLIQILVLQGWRQRKVAG